MFKGELCVRGHILPFVCKSPGRGPTHDFAVSQERNKPPGCPLSHPTPTHCWQNTALFFTVKTAAITPWDKHRVLYFVSWNQPNNSGSDKLSSLAITGAGGVFHYICFWLVFTHISRILMCGHHEHVTRCVAPDSANHMWSPQRPSTALLASPVTHLPTNHMPECIHIDSVPRAWKAHKNVCGMNMHMNTQLLTA